MTETEQMSQTMYVSNETVFHAVYIPEENIDTSTESYAKGRSIVLKIRCFLFCTYYTYFIYFFLSFNVVYFYVTENIRVYQDKAEALKVIKEFKTGRLKSFKKRSEAEEYAKTGFEKTNYINNTSISTTVPVVEEKSNNFKAPRSQDLVCFRKLIKDGNLYAVRTIVWVNPRYLIGSGDTPAILQVRHDIYNHI